MIDHDLRHLDFGDGHGGGRRPLGPVLALVEWQVERVALTGPRVFVTLDRLTGSDPRRFRSQRHAARGGAQPVVLRLLGLLRVADRRAV